MQTQNYLNTDYRIFYIKFQFKSSGFICYGNNIPKILKTNENTGHGVEFIKEFDSYKNKFTRINKRDILLMFKHNEIEYNYLINHHYFSNLK